MDRNASMNRAVAPYGTWESPVTAKRAATDGRRIDDLAVVGEFVCWVERRPEEAGRNVLVCRRPDGRTQDLTPTGFDVRSRVHEYGGGAFCLFAGRDNGAPDHAFVHFADQRVYLVQGGGIEPLTPADGVRYADLTWDRRRRRLIAVAERPDPEGGEETAALVSIRLPPAKRGGSARARASSDPPAPTELASGADFYSSPRLSPDGSAMSWLDWNHPDMPWDATALWLAAVDDDGTLKTPRRIAGGDPASPEAIQQPSFDDRGRLAFVSDRSGWWNLYRVEDDGEVGALCPSEAEFGVPPWLFGMSTYAHTKAGIVAACCDQGVWRLVRLPEADADGDAAAAPVETPYTSIAWLRAAETGVTGASAVVFLGAAPDRVAEIARLQSPDRADGAAETEVLLATGPAPDRRYLSTGRPIEYPSAGGRRAFGFFYPPKNDDACAPAESKPPLIVKSHGGPTSAAEHVYDSGIQYWTSRGFAVVDVNYGGSTGYGRAYRELLRGEWGVVDVEDCVAAAEWLAAAGEVDRSKLFIRGGSAGGYTTLAALAFRDTFAAGASHYGVADLSALARDTHKFESRYLDRLVGPYPERADLYRERSPLEARDGFSCPVIFFQGSEDRIVPPNQAEAMVAALNAKGLRVEYLLFDGEQHGFRQASNIIRALEAELAFYRETLGLPRQPEGAATGV